MNTFEKLALLNFIEGIETQLRSLKSLIGNVGVQTEPTHRTTKLNKQDVIAAPQELTEDEETLLEKSIKEAQQAEVERLKAKAASFFETNAQQILGGISQPTAVPTPPPHPLEPQDNH